MKTNNFLTKMALAAALFIFISCQKDETEELPLKTDISGVVQKGPFNAGTTVTLSELDDDFAQTGKTFTTEINSDDGVFQLNNIQLSSSYAALKADGFYFDEINGENSAAKITLNAIADTREKSTININVLTHLEKPRVVYLLANGYTFTEAKAKAKQEVLEVFNLSGAGNVAPEMLDITKSGAENAALLAVSAILQGYRSVADLSEMLTHMANDLREDGTLDNPELQTSLVSQALYVDAGSVRQNLTNKYTGLGGAVAIPDFHQPLGQFISSTSFSPASRMDYPEQSAKGANILNPGHTVFESGMETNYSMAAQTLPGLSLKIELKVVEGDMDGRGAWGYRADKINWDVTNYDFENHIQTFQVIDLNQPADLKIVFMVGGIKVQVKYMEGIREWTRILTVS